MHLITSGVFAVAIIAVSLLTLFNYSLANGEDVGFHDRFSRTINLKRRVARSARTRAIVIRTGTTNSGKLSVGDASVFQTPLVTAQPWPALKVGWGSDGTGSKNPFADVPKTVSEALRQGFVLKENSCKNNRQPFVGLRYWKPATVSADEESRLILIYDNTREKKIAGLQIAVPKALLLDEPIFDAFVEDGDFWTITAYFREPALLCGVGASSRSKTLRSSFGDRLILQIGENSFEELLPVVTLERSVDAALWKKGHCVPGMGVHYWFRFESVGSSCECKQGLYPFFTLYNEGTLIGFGFAVAVNRTTSSFLERVEGNAKQMFPQQCSKHSKDVLTQHVYFTENPAEISCPPPNQQPLRGLRQKKQQKTRKAVKNLFGSN